MSHLSKQDIEKKLSEYQDPYLHKDLIQLKAIKDITIQADLVTIDITLGYPNLGVQDEMIAALKKLLNSITNTEIKINITHKITGHLGQPGIKSLPNIKNVLAVASGKGGVGKSTTAVNLALALAKEGARVGILDADIYGPSQPLMLGVIGMPERPADKVLRPIVRHGIQSMSIGYLIAEKSPMVWRGPMVSTALQQLLNDTQWEDLDYLIIDLPPGTGDIQLTLAQKIPVSGALIVTTPQDLALLDARRACEMFKKVNVPVLGMIENMSVHVCTQCGHAEHIFGAGGGETLAKEYGLELLAALPLDIKIREETDGGTPTVVSDPDSQNARIYRELARCVAAKLSLQTTDYSHKFPNIVVKND
ncbi:MAG: iron-sulfur cluster carrier protein ApbC [Gammaproteobacteria bacterium]|nr:iron-sulfur cluster carrier protein ApbC [Gammaproteobacteria bacterium]